jgi:YHS domain-containing protein
MKKLILTAMILAGALVAPALANGADKKADKPKPYPLDTCVVSGEKLGGDMGKPYVFTYKGREIKLCCKGCLKEFKKEPAKYIKKIEEAEKQAEKNQPPQQKQ